jgi:hypothetical protein
MPSVGIADSETQEMKAEPEQPNHSIQRTGASRLGQSQFVAQRRLAPVADAER